MDGGSATIGAWMRLDAEQQNIGTSDANTALYYLAVVCFRPSSWREGLIPIDRVSALRVRLALLLYTVSTTGEI